MKITYFEMKKSINIFSDGKVMSSKFKIAFLSEVLKIYDVVEEQNRATENQLMIYEVMGRANISQEEKSELLLAYNADSVDDITFEEYCDLTLIVFQDLFLFEKDCHRIIDERKNKHKAIAKIDLLPDGDGNSIWIDIYSKHHIIKNQIRDIVNSIYK